MLTEHPQPLCAVLYVCVSCDVVSGVQSCCLAWYKSIDEKKELLDQAISTVDGNCIMAVILFIKKTVDQCKLNSSSYLPLSSYPYSPALPASL